MPFIPDKKSGFTPDQTTPSGFVKQEPENVKKSFWQKVGGIASGVGNALTSSEQNFGKAFSTVFDSNSQNVVNDISQQESQGQQSVIQAIHNQTDPLKKQDLIGFLKKHYGADYQSPTVTDLNPGFGMSNKEVLGAAAGTALDIASAGSYGAGVKAAESGKLLTKSPTIMSLAEKAGLKTTDQIPLTIAEIAASKSKPLLNVAKKVVTGAVMGYGYDVAGNAQANKDNTTKPGFGSLLGAINPLAVEAIKGFGFITKQIAKYTSSALSGVPVSAIEHAFENPYQVQSAIVNASIDNEGAAQKILADAHEAMGSLIEARQQAYKEGLAKLEKETFYTKNGQLYVKRVLTPAEAAATKGYTGGMIGVPTQLTTGGVKNVFTKTLKEFGATGGGKTGYDFTNVALDENHISKLEKLQQRIYNWNDTTPTGLNRLRQVISSYRIGGINLGSSENKFNSIVSSLENNLNSYVGKKVPQIAEMNAKYNADSRVIENIQSQLKLNSADPNTALRKLLSVFNPKSEIYRPVVEQLGEKGAKSLMSDIAGLTMSKWTPEGLSKYFNLSAATAILAPKALITAPLASPKVLGNLATTAGKVYQNKTAQKTGQNIVKAVEVGKKMATRQAGLNK